MKILICTNSFEKVTNGPAKFANLILEVNDLFPEHEIHILSEDVTIPSHFVHRIKLNIPWILKPLGQVLRMFQYHYRATQIRKGTFQFDVLVYNNAFIGLWSSLRFSKTIGMINDYNNALSHFKDVFKGKRYLKQFVFKQLEKICVRSHKRIITNSKYLGKQLQQVYPGIKNKERLMYKSIEIDVPVRENLILHDPVRILFVKNDFVVGGLFDLIEALSMVDFNYSLTVIGPPSSYNKEIEDFANVFNTQLHLLGPLPQEDVFAHLLNTDIFCVPSRKEALGIANMEAMARGVAVVSTNAGGIPEVLNDGTNGWLVPVADPKALSAALTDCISNEKEREQRIRSAKKFVNNFSKDNMYRRFLEITAEVYGK
jgi:colanic acid/amylovoran biosynthesis glycosyltransferase